MYTTILFSVDGEIARLTLNRPDSSTVSIRKCTSEVRDALGRLPE